MTSKRTCSGVVSTEGYVEVAWHPRKQHLNGQCHEGHSRTYFIADVGVMWTPSEMTWISILSTCDLFLLTWGVRWTPSQMMWTTRLMTCNGFLLTWVVVWTPSKMMWTARLLTCVFFLLTWTVHYGKSHVDFLILEMPNMTEQCHTGHHIGH